MQLCSGYREINITHRSCLTTSRLGFELNEVNALQMCTITVGPARCHITFMGEFFTTRADSISAFLVGVVPATQ